MCLLFVVIRCETEFQRASQQSNTTTNKQLLLNGASGIEKTARLQLKRKREEGQEGALDGAVVQLLTEDIATAIPTTTSDNECFFREAPATYENTVFFWCGSQNCKGLIQTAFDSCPASVCKSEFVRKILLQSALTRVKQSAVQSVVQNA